MFLTAVLVAAVVAQTEPVKLASPGFKGVNMPPDVAAFYSEHFASELAISGLKVITQSEIAALLGLERQKQLLGCSDESTSCLAEMGNALGVDAVISGNIARLGKVIQVNVKIVHARDATQLSVLSDRTDSEDEMLEKLSQGARRMAAEVSRKLGRAAPAVSAEVSSTGSTRRTWALAPMIGGVALMGAGVVFALQAQSNYAAVTDPNTTLRFPEAEQKANAAKSQSTLGVVFGAAGAVATAVGAGLFFTGGSDQTVSFYATDSTAGVAFGGTFR